jgi:hypothetical protein
MEQLIQYKEMREAITRVREMHKSTPDNECAYCVEPFGDYWINSHYPCDTIEALDGEQ